MTGIKGVNIAPVPTTRSAGSRKSKSRLCFVIGPIGAYRSEERTHADRLLKLIIRPTFATHFKAFKVERADEIARPGLIDSQVISRLIEADLVIADLTTRNANAFYELGIRHMLQKPIIHMFQRGDTIPADIAPYRAVEFCYEGKWDIRDTKVALRKAVTEVLQPSFQIENPVTRSAGFIRMQNALGEERGRAAMMATGLREPLKTVQERLDKFANSQSDVLKFKPSYFAELTGPLQSFGKRLNDVVIAIANIGTKMI